MLVERQYKYGDDRRARDELSSYFCVAFDYVDSYGQTRSIAQCCCDCRALDQWVTSPFSKEYRAKAAEVAIDRIRVPYPGGAQKVSPRTMISVFITLLVVPLHYYLGPCLFLLALYGPWRRITENYVWGIVVAHLLHSIAEALWEEQPGPALFCIPLFAQCPPSTNYSAGPVLPWRAEPRKQAQWCAWYVISFILFSLTLKNSFFKLQCPALAALGCARLLYLAFFVLIIAPRRTRRDTSSTEVDEEAVPIVYGGEQEAESEINNKL